MKQVSSSHYDFSYMNMRRWASVWYQLRETLELQPKSVLELGPGPGIFKAAIAQYGIDVKTLDHDPDLQPDYVGAASEMPFDDESWDLVCAFQMLEHLPYEDSLKAVREMRRVAERYLLISLPDRTPSLRLLLDAPWVGVRQARFDLPNPWSREHLFNGEHYWEIGKRGYPVRRIIEDFKACDLTLRKTFRAGEIAYHRFFVFERIPSNAP